MSISYSGLTSYGRVTLPSVESWGTNMNILKDPPKGIMTRRRDKVGQTSSIVEDIDAAKDRACEAIRVYPRGINPAVSVMYSNNGTVGGNNSSCTGQLMGSASASLPYKIMNGGAFRPPVLTQEQLLPLSRQPRTTTCAFTQPGFADWTKKIRVCGTAENTRQVKTTLLKSNVQSARTIKLVKPMTKPYEVKYCIKDNIAASTSCRSNKSNNRNYYNGGTKMNTKCYTQVRLDVSANTNKKSNVNYKRPVENKQKNRPRNVPLSSWERGAGPTKDYSTRNYNYKLGRSTNRGGEMSGVASKPRCNDNILGGSG
jgi:hypothetical protein